MFDIAKNKFVILIIACRFSACLTIFHLSCTIYFGLNDCSWSITLHDFFIPSHLYVLSYFTKFDAISIHPGSFRMYLSTSFSCFSFITDSG